MFITVLDSWPEPVAAQVDASPVRISGSCQVKAGGQLFVFLVDRSQFSVPMTGIEVFEQTVTAGVNTVRYSFLVAPGWYGVRAFLDTNGNRQLDRGLFGPAEPWGMSWQVRRPAGFPAFTDIAFPATEHYRCKPIVVE